MLVLINERAAAFWLYCYIIVATTTTPIFVATYERYIVMKTFAFTDSDRIVVVKKSQGEMTVTIKLKDADKDSQKKISFMPCRLVSVLLYGTTTTTRSSADADNGLDAFSGQSRSTNMVPFHMLHIVSYCVL